MRVKLVKTVSGATIELTEKLLDTLNVGQEGEVEIQAGMGELIIRPVRGEQSHPVASAFQRVVEGSQETPPPGDQTAAA